MSRISYCDSAAVSTDYQSKIEHVVNDINGQPLATNLSNER